MRDALLISQVTTPAGPLAEEMGRLGWQMTWMGAAIFLLVLVLLVVGLFRKKSTDEANPPGAVRKWIVGAGVILSAVVITVVFGLTLVAMRATSLDAGDNTLTIEVTGHQWWWEVSYPDLGVVTANEVHLPVGRPVELVLTSADVIHSFWVPQLGGKMDMLPDGTNTYVVQANDAGEFSGVCAEFCGLQHARMHFVAVASPDEEFAAWSERESAPASEPTGEQARAGREVFRRQGCGECHTIRGTDASGDRAPDLTHLAARRTLAAGTLENTTRNLRAWISNPHRFKEGVEMPSFELAEEEMDALIAYLESLE